MMVNPGSYLQHHHLQQQPLPQQQHSLGAKEVYEIVAIAF
jgi:hypothetical protein